MKKLILVLLPLGILLTSCSDKLTDSKAKSLLEKCFEKKKDELTTNIITGENMYLSSDSLEMKKLASEGYLKLAKNPKNPYDDYDNYNISLTEKSTPFLVESKDNISSSGKKIGLIHRMKIGEPIVNKINSIHENPSTNTAEANVIFTVEKKTPFWELSDKQQEIQAQKVIFYNTNNGWIFCQ